MRRLRTLAITIAVAFTPFLARADDFETTLRSAFQLPASAEIAWPPRTGLREGSFVDSDLRVLAVDSATHIGTFLPPYRSPRWSPRNGFSPLTGSGSGANSWRVPDQLVARLKLSDLQRGTFQDDALGNAVRTSA